MAWPNSGDWDGLRVTELSGIAAAICVGINERFREMELLYGQKLGASAKLFVAPSRQVEFVTATPSVTKRFPTAADFDGMRVDDSSGATSLWWLMDQIRNAINAMYTNASHNKWYKASDFAVERTLANALTEVDILDSIALPKHYNNVDWWLTIKGVLDKSLYFRGYQPFSVAGNLYQGTHSGGGSTVFDDAWSGGGDLLDSEYGLFARWIYDPGFPLNDGAYVCKSSTIHHDPSNLIQSDVINCTNHLTIRNTGYGSFDGDFDGTGFSIGPHDTYTHTYSGTKGQTITAHLTAKSGILSPPSGPYLDMDHWCEIDCDMSGFLTDQA